VASQLERFGDSVLRHNDNMAAEVHKNVTLCDLE
jgi:hypothetical protein